MLHRIYNQTKERVHFVPGKVARIGERPRDFIFPCLGEPFAGGSLHELLHFGGHASHISWTTENHRISLIEVVDPGDRFLDCP